MFSETHLIFMLFETNLVFVICSRYLGIHHTFPSLTSPQLHDAD